MHKTHEDLTSTTITMRSLADHGAHSYIILIPIYGVYSNAVYANRTPYPYMVSIHNITLIIWVSTANTKLTT